MYAIDSNDYDEDGDIDVVIGGNQYYVVPEMGIYDASFGSYLQRDNAALKFETLQSGFNVKGEIRDLFSVDNNLYVVRSRDSLVTYTFK